MQTNNTNRYQYLYFAILSILMFFVLEKSYSQFVKGADIGWLSQMEATGYKFYDSTGVQKNCLEILKEKGINTVRLRVWVNPSNDKISGHCSKKEVAAMAILAKNMGMRIMIDFHYSDSWADPGKQTKPAAWTNHTFNQLLTDVYDHTFEVLDTLKSIGAKPDWAQIGNEIIGGMLWPDGSTSNWGQLSQLLNKGYDATKAIDSTIKVIIHIDQGNNNGRFRTFFDNVKNYGIKYDIIGASYYPYWLGTDYTVTINDLGNNLNDMASRYNKDVMVVEVGGDYTLIQNTYDMLVAVIKKVNSVTNNRGLGVIYWEPEGAKSWSGYQLSCWGSNGKPTAALNAFLINLNLSVNTIKDKQNISIYPNPFLEGSINIDLKGLTGETIIKLLNLNGKVVKSIVSKHEQLVTIDKSGLKSGVYFIQIDNAQQKAVKTIIAK